MPDPSLWLILSVGLTFFLAGIVKGVTGMGLPTVAMGVLGALMAPVTAAALLIVPSFVTNVWQLATGPSFTVLIRRLWPMMLGIVLGTVAGSFILADGNTRWTTAGLGSALMVYDGFTLVGRQVSVSAPWEDMAPPPGRLAKGIGTGGPGAFVFPSVPH